MADLTVSQEGAGTGAVVTYHPPSPMDMIAQAVERGADVAMITQLVALQERVEKNAGRRAFDAAIAAAKAEIGPIAKNRLVDFKGKTGVRTNYRHEDFAEVARTVDPVLGRHGLSYRFRTEQEPTGGIRVVCIIAHRDGYSEENSLVAGRDDSGNKNNIQAIGSTQTYLQRYTLKAALGLAASNDDDGEQSGKPADGPISDEQAETIHNLLETSGGDADKLCAWLKVETVADITESMFPAVVRALAKRMRAAEPKGDDNA